MVQKKLAADGKSDQKSNTKVNSPAKGSSDDINIEEEDPELFNEALRKELREFNQFDFSQFDPKKKQVVTKKDETAPIIRQPQKPQAPLPQYADVMAGRRATDPNTKSRFHSSESPKRSQES